MFDIVFEKLTVFDGFVVNVENGELLALRKKKYHKKAVPDDGGADDEKSNLVFHLE